MTTDYDPKNRWEAALDLALRHGVTLPEAMEFADHTGGDGGETSIRTAWRAWQRGRM